MVKPTICLSLTVLIAVASQSSSFAKSEPIEVLKYFNPLSEKGYLNKSQDRAIKKKSFKASQLPMIEPVANKELGFFAVIKPSENTNLKYLEELLANKQVNGVSIVFSWQQLEPVEDEYKWDLIDPILDVCSKYGKTAILRISTAGLDQNESDTPKWVFDAGTKSLAYTGLDGKQYSMPIFWDTTYLANWGNFVSELGARYDKNPNIHSVGITGGGVLIGTRVQPQGLPAFQASKESKATADKLEDVLIKEHGMTQRQLAQHWKYVVDLFAQAFPNARLNLNIDPPTLSRAGQDTLDDIADYSIMRYGERVFVTKQNISSGKHGFDDYRLLLKYRPDTLTGLQLTEGVTGEEMGKVARTALDDGISFAEIPAGFFSSQDPLMQKGLSYLASHIGYQLMAQQAVIPKQVVVGEPIKTSFKFLNFGAATAKKPSRQLDKDVPASYRMEIQLKDSSGKPVVISYHTPENPTNNWAAGQAVSWEEELRMPQLTPGEYSVSLAVVDSETKRKIGFINFIDGKEPIPTQSIDLGTIKVLPASQSIGQSPAVEQK